MMVPSHARKKIVKGNVATVAFLILLGNHASSPSSAAAANVSDTPPSPPPAPLSPPSPPPPVPMFAQGHCLYVSCTCDGLKSGGDQCGCQCDVGNDVLAPVVGRAHESVCGASYDGAAGGSCCGAVAESSIASRAALLAGGDATCRKAWEALLCVLQCDPGLAAVDVTAGISSTAAGIDPARYCVPPDDIISTGTRIPAQTHYAEGPKVGAGGEREQRVDGWLGVKSCRSNAVKSRLLRPLHSRSSHLVFPLPFLLFL